MTLIVWTLLLSLKIKSEDNKILSCYFTNWAYSRNSKFKYLAEDMYPFLCTHVLYAFGGIDTRNLVPIPTDRNSDLAANYGLDNFNKVTSMKNINPDLKVLFSIGGYQKLLSQFATASKTVDNAKTFARNTKKFLEKHNFDGLDIDWEYPKGHKDAFTRLLKAISEEFNKNSSKKYLLTIAVSAGESNIKASYDIKNVAKYVDYINVMTYDFFGLFTQVVGHQSALYNSGSDHNWNTDYAVKYWIKHGAPASKILIGSPTYGRGFKTKTNNPQLGDFHIGGTPGGSEIYTPGILTYMEYCNEGYKEVWDDKQKVAHGVKGNYWIGLDTPRSIKEKGKYVYEMSLAGMFAWTLDFDDFSGNQCHKGKSPLIGAMHEALNIYPGIDWKSQLNTNISSPSPVHHHKPIVNGDNVCSDYGSFALPGCKQFMVCTHIGKPGYVKNCYNGLLYDAKINACNWYKLVDCPVSAQETTSAPSTTSVKSTTTPLATEEATETTTSHTDDKFPSNEATTENIPTTEAPTEPPSDPTTITTAPDTTVSPTLPPHIDNNNVCTSVGYFPADHCTKFINCAFPGQIGIPQNCPPGLLFDVSINNCNWPSLVNCQE